MVRDTLQVSNNIRKPKSKRGIHDKLDSPLGGGGKSDVRECDVVCDEKLATDEMGFENFEISQMFLR